MPPSVQDKDALRATGCSVFEYIQYISYHSPLTVAQVWPSVLLHAGSAASPAAMRPSGTPIASIIIITAALKDAMYRGVGMLLPAHIVPTPGRPIIYSGSPAVLSGENAVFQLSVAARNLQW